MSKCDDLFQRKLNLDLKRNKINEDIARVAKIRMSNNMPDDDFFKKAQDRIADYLEDKEAADFIDKAIKDPKAEDVFVSIGQNRPTNFVQQLRTKPEEVVADWASYSQAFLRAGKDLMPEKYSFLDADLMDAAKKVSESLGSKKTAAEFLDIFNRGLNPVEVTFVEDILRSRWIHDTSKQTYIDLVNEIGDFMADNPNVEVPAELMAKAWNTQKVAFMAEANYDFFRNQWSRAGKAQQGEIFDDVLEVMQDESDFIPKNITNPVDYVESLGIANKKISDLTEEEPFSRILTASSENITRPEEAYDQLALELMDIRIMGTDPRKRIDPKYAKDAMFRHTNLMVKDSQLFNERTGGLALGSNTVMALYGPYKNLWKDILYEPYGTETTRGFWKRFADSWQAHSAGYGAAVKAVRDSGKELFMDAWRGDAMFFSSNVETYGKFKQTVDERLAELRAALNVTPETERGKMLQRFNPFKYRRTFHAAARLYLWRKTKHPAALRPGLSMLGAIDAPFGYGYHVYKVRSELEQRVRAQGVQLGIFNKTDADAWVRKEFNKQFYSMQVTEDQVKAYRKQQSIPPGVVTDDVLKNEIRELRVRQTYGAPVPTEVGKSASEFSERMRFQNKPQDGSPIKPLYDAANALRRSSPLLDITTLPYLQAPTAAMSLTGKLSGAGPTFDLIRHFTGSRRLNPEQIADMKADFIMAGHLYAAALGLIASDNIIGNGPIDPKERAQWKRDLEARGKKPNSIMGLQFLGNPPVIEELFLLADIVESGKSALRSDFDNKTIADSVLGVIAGSLERKTALGNVSQLFELFYGNEFDERKFDDMATYTAGGQIPGIGLIRGAERVSKSKKYNLYRERPFTKEEIEMFDIGVLERAEQTLRNYAYGITGLAGVVGGKYKDKDWLGTDIKLPFGMDAKRYLEHRFFPMLHPNDKVYAELQILKLLDPPTPLLKRTLEGVPMSDDLQKEYNDTYGSIIPEIGPTGRAEMGGSRGRSITVNIPFSIVDKNLGIKIKKNQKVFSLPVNPILEKHTKGNTFINAARSLMNDPLYKAFEATPATTADVTVEGGDKTPRELTKTPQAVLMRQLKRFYEISTTDALRRSESEAAQTWVEREAIFDREAREAQLEYGEGVIDALSTKAETKAQ
tara:strand:+ start:2222 stop:5647 length:3426 start_codon:yes stop_codon:yes gene_type:complete